MSDKRKPFFNDEIVKIIRQTGELAMEEARKHGTYIVFKNKEGNIVRKYPDGRIIKESECDD